jgi:transglutaminase-like putative cysteine protease
MHIVWHGLRPFTSGFVPLCQLAGSPGRVVRGYYRTTLLM